MGTARTISDISISDFSEVYDIIDGYLRFDDVASINNEVVSGFIPN